MGSAQSATAKMTTTSAARRTVARRLPPSRVLDAQLLTGHRAVSELRRRPLEHDGPLLHDVAAIADAQGHPRVLLDEQDGDAEPHELADPGPEVADERRREPLGGL